jgi:hypothetical protein
MSTTKLGFQFMKEVEFEEYGRLGTAAAVGTWDV